MCVCASGVSRSLLPSRAKTLNLDVYVPVVDTVVGRMVNTSLSSSYSDQWILRVLNVMIGSFMSVDAGEGVHNQLWAATAKEVVGGSYYVPVGKKGVASADARDDELVERLWEWTEKELERWV